MFISRGCRRALDGKRFLHFHIEKSGQTIAGTPVWTPAELETLRTTYSDRDSACSSLHLRTWAAIRQKARSLGLVRPLRIWTPIDVARLRCLYPKGIPIGELVGHFEGKTKRQIWHKASHLRVKRPRRPPRITGHPLVDSVRQQAFRLGYSMADLNAWTSSKRYFNDARYVDWPALQKAIEAMGGKIVIRWRHSERPSNDSLSGSAS